MVEDNRRVEAEALARALELGILKVREVTGWADSIIEATPSPDIEICEIALMTRESPEKVALALRELPGQAERRAVNQQLLLVLARSFLADERRAYAIAKALFDLAVAGAIDDPRVEGLAFRSWDAFDLIRRRHRLGQTRGRCSGDALDARGLLSRARARTSLDFVSPAPTGGGAPRLRNGDGRVGRIGRFPGRLAGPLGRRGPPRPCGPGLGRPARQTEGGLDAFSPLLPCCRTGRTGADLLLDPGLDSRLDGWDCAQYAHRAQNPDLWTTDQVAELMIDPAFGVDAVLLGERMQIGGPAGPAVQISDMTR